MLASLMGPRGGVSLHSLDKRGRNALHILAGTQPTKNENESESERRAKSEARMQLVQHLVAKGTCRGGGVNVREKDAGHSPLHDCAAKGDTELLALLCKHGGDVLLRNIKGKTEHTPPHTPHIPPHMRLTLCCAEGETPLHVACRVGSKEAVLLLLAPKEGRETLHLLDSASSYSPLVTALMHGHRDIVTWLLGSPASAEPGGSLGLEVDAKDAQGRAAIHYAAEGGNLAALKLLLEYRADINAKEITTGSTALHIASGCASIRRSLAVIDPQS